MNLVIDTNWALDLLLFDEPAAASVRAALQTEQARWLATQGMRGELARVLTYAALQKQLAAPRAPVLCSDADDQPFIDLALAHQATLLTKDRRVLATARRLAPLGARVAQRWNAVNEAQGQTANKCFHSQQNLKSGGV